MTVVANEKNKLIPLRPVRGWKVCMDYRKLNSWTLKDHFPMPFMDQMLDRLEGKGWYCFLDSYSGYNQICNALEVRRRQLLHAQFNIVLDWEKCHFMVKEDIVLGHNISKKGIEVDRAKVEVIERLRPAISMKGEAKFSFDEDHLKAFECLKGKLVEAPIIVAPNWSKPFEIMCDASGVSLVAALG
ncbi:uncharacterized protein LOC124891025 [Capsicum annuum]|uniref:uncharacterized protein LOC124891025 n=1 Tax=Capsicum annuum TaxID=4072 RepID=UPI001FB113F8|nr:uncharacterized protein LOC124891025 [Capsicum annuum]